MQLLVLLVGSFAIYGAILIVGLCTTQRVGLPSISRMLADNPELSICFVAAVIVYGMVCFDIIAKHEWADSEDLWAAVLRYASYVCLIGQIVFLAEVALVSLDYNETAHFAVAGTAGVFSFLLAMLMCARRWDKISVAARVFNVLVILALLVVMILFPLLAWEEQGGYIELNVAVIEYVVFLLIVFVPVFDLAEPEVRVECKLI